MLRHIEANVRIRAGYRCWSRYRIRHAQRRFAGLPDAASRAQPVNLTPAQMLYLATRAGAEALGIADQTGDFECGKAADFVYLRPPEGGVLAGVLKRLEDSERIIAALFTLAGAESVREVR